MPPLAALWGCLVAILRSCRAFFVLDWANHRDSGNDSDELGASIAHCHQHIPLALAGLRFFPDGRGVRIAIDHIFFCQEPTVSFRIKRMMGQTSYRGFITIRLLQLHLRISTVYTLSSSFAPPSTSPHLCSVRTLAARNQSQSPSAPFRCLSL